MLMLNIKELKKLSINFEKMISDFVENGNADIKKTILQTLAYSLLMDNTNHKNILNNFLNTNQNLEKNRYLTELNNLIANPFIKALIPQLKKFQADLDGKLKENNDSLIQSIEIREPLLSVSINFLTQFLDLAIKLNIQKDNIQNQVNIQNINLLFDKLEKDLNELFEQKIENNFDDRSSRAGVLIGGFVAVLAFLAAVLILTASGPTTAAIFGLTLLASLLVYLVTAFITYSIYSKVKSGEKQLHIESKKTEIEQTVIKNENTMKNNFHNFFQNPQTQHESKEIDSPNLNLTNN